MPAAAIAPDARVFPPGVAACLCVDAAAGRMWTYDASAQNVIVSRSGWGSGRGGDDSGADYRGGGGGSGNEGGGGGGGSGWGAGASEGAGGWGRGGGMHHGSTGGQAPSGVAAGAAAALLSFALVTGPLVHGCRGTGGGHPEPLNSLV